MNCPHCGAEVPSGSAFCYACRKRLSGAPSAGAAGPQPPPLALEHGGTTTLARPGLVTVIAVLDLLGALGCLVAAGLLVWGAVSDPHSRLAFALSAAAAGLFALLQLVCGLGLLGLKPFARPMQIGFSILSICNPLSILVLIYMLRPGLRVLFSGRSAVELSPAEHELVQRDGAGGVAAIVAVVVVAVLALFAVPFIGIVAAIAIPSLLQAKVAANESANLGDARSVVSAQITYASQSGGSYAPRLECLVTPKSCRPSAPDSPFLDDSTARSPKSGYIRRMIVPAGEASFVYVAVPTAPQQTGRRSFCADHEGHVCATDNPSVFDDLDGSGCPQSPVCDQVY